MIYDLLVLGMENRQGNLDVKFEQVCEIQSNPDNSLGYRPQVKLFRNVT